MHTNHVRQKKNLIFLPLLCLEGKASAHVRAVSFLHNLGNERQSGDSVSSLTWKKYGAQENMISEHARRGRDHRTPECDEKGWRVLLHSVRKALLTTNHWKEKTKGVERIPCEWKGGKKRWPSKYNQSQWWLSWETEGQHKMRMTENFWQQLRKPGETAVSLTKEGGDKMND